MTQVFTIKSVVTASIILIWGVIWAKDPEYQWNNLKIGGGGYVTGIVIHPKQKDIMYIRTDVGGAYRWDIKKNQWEQILNWVGPENSNLIGVDGMALDPGNPNRIYLALGRKIDEEGGVFRSEDKGKNWEKLLSVSYEGNGRNGRWIGECIGVDPINSSVIYAGTRKEGLWRSLDDGKKWEKINSVPEGYTGMNPTGVRTIVFDSAEKIEGRSSKIYVGIPGNGIFVSSDGGKLFKLIPGSPQNPARMQVVEKELFVSHSTGVSLYSNDKWLDISPKANCNYVGLCVDETNSRNLVTAQRYSKFLNPIFRSKDKGLHWEEINTGKNSAHLNMEVPWWPKAWFSSATAGMAFAPGGGGSLFFTDWFGVWNTSNIWSDSTKWRTVESGHEEVVVLTLVSPPSGALVYSGVADVFGFKHISLDQYPEKRLYPLQECFNIAVCEKKPSSIAALGAKSWGGDQTTFITSSDSGETWEKQTLPEGSVLGTISISATDPNKLIYISGQGIAYYSHDNGKNWNTCKNLPVNLVTFNTLWTRDDILFSDKVDGSFYILKDGALYTSSNGIFWSKRAKIPVSEPSGYYKSVFTAPDRKGEIWICLEKEGLWKTTNGGNSYSQIKAFNNARLITMGAPAPGSCLPTIYCYGKINETWGLFRSVDLGVNWTLLNDKNHQFPAGVKALTADRNKFGRIYIGSGGRGVYYGSLISDSKL
jgi:photosystem II stability/assembly factor-like uncharacterized protein